MQKSEFLEIFTIQFEFFGLKILIEHGFVFPPLVSSFIWKMHSRSGVTKITTRVWQPGKTTITKNLKRNWIRPDPGNIFFAQY